MRIPIEFNLDMGNCKEDLAPAKYKEMGQRVLGEAIVKVEDYIKEEVPKNDEMLKDSIDSRCDLESLTGEVYSTGCQYVRHIIYGTKPHVIRPKNKKALYWKGLDHPIAKVDHPGTRPNDFPRRALNRFRDSGFVEKRMAYYSQKWKTDRTKKRKRPGAFVGLGGRKMGAGRGRGRF